MRKSSFHLLAVFFLAFVVGTCADADTNSPFEPLLVEEEEGEEIPIPPMQPAADILDGWRGGGNPGFHWLYPMVQSTGYSGTFDGSLGPRVTVEVCELDGDSCPSGPIKVFSATSGSYYDLIRVSPRREYYMVYWSTASARAGNTYRATVFLDGDTELGHADVKIVATRGDVGTVDANQNVGIAAGDWLAIRWRLEEGVDEFNTPPEVSISTPPDGATVPEGEVTLQGSATDAQDGDLTPAIQWTVDSQVDPLGTGGSLDVTLSPGTHVLTASATDTQGATGSSTVTITVKENSLPEVTISQPEDGLGVEAGEAFQLQGTASDEEDGELSSSIAWDSDLEADPLGTGSSLSVSLTTPGTHTLTASVTDSQGLTGSASVEVVVSIPNEVPSVEITGPVEGAVFEPGDVITFTGTSSDPDEGDLSDQIVWSSNKDGELGAGASLSPNLSGGAHLITASITDGAGATVTDEVNILVGIVGLQQEVTVPFGDVTSLPITLAEPAPPGGLTVTVVSDAPGIVEVRTPTVTISEGARAGNASLYGVAPGNANLTASTPDLGSDQSVATVSGELDFDRSRITFTPAFGDEELTLSLLSGGSAAIAPPGGLEVSLTAGDPQCIAVPAALTIPGGEGGTSAAVTYAGTAELPCETSVTASAPNVSAAQVTIEALAAPVVQLPPELFVEGVGSGLRRNAGGNLSSSDHGGVMVTITSPDPSKLLVSGIPGGTAQESVQISVGNGNTYFAFAVHALEGLAGQTATLAATANGFEAGSTTVDIVQPYLSIRDVPDQREVFGDDTRPQVQAGVLNQSGTAINGQDFRLGTPLEVTYRSSDASLAAFDLGDDTYSDEITVPLSRPVLQANDIGTVTISASIPGFLAFAGSDEAEMEIIGSGIDLVTTSPVGKGLMQSFRASLSVRPPVDTEVTITSDNPDVFLVSTGTSVQGGGPVAGVTTTVLIDKDRDLNAYFYVHALEDAAGPATVTVSAPGYAPSTSEILIAEPGFRFGAYDASGGGRPENTLSTLRTDGSYRVNVGALEESGYLRLQSARSDGPGFTASFTSSDPVVAAFPDGSGGLSPTVGGSIDALGRSYSALIDPRAAGTTTISAQVLDSGGNPIAASGASSGVLTVFTPPAVDNRYSPQPTPNGLMRAWSPYMDDAAPVATPVTIVSSDPSVLQVGPADYSSPGETFEYTVPAGNGQIRMALHGMSEGTVTLTVSAPQYATVTREVEVGPPSVRLIGVDITQKTFDPDDGFAAEVGYSPSGASGLSSLPVRFGAGDVTVTVTNSDPSVGEIVSDAGVGQTATVVIPEGEQRNVGSLAFSPLVNGTTTLRASAPGFSTVNWPSSTITVTSPGIDVRYAPNEIAAGFYIDGVRSYLGASEHGGVNVTIESSNPSKILVGEADGSNPGASVTVFVPNGSTRFDYSVHGVAGETATGVQIKASALGFLDGTEFVDLVPAGFRFGGMSYSGTAGAGTRSFSLLLEGARYTYVKVSDPAGLTVTLSVDDPALAQVTNGTDTGQTVTVTIPQGANRIDGLGWVPLAEGSTGLTITAPDVRTAAVTLTINP